MARSQPSSKLSILGICLLVAFLAASADAASLRGTKEAAVVDENAEDSEDFYQAIIDEPFEDAPEDEQPDEERELHVTGFAHKEHTPGGYRGGYRGSYGVVRQNDFWMGGGGGGMQDATRNSYFISSNRAPYSNTWNSWNWNNPAVGFNGATVYERAFYNGPRQQDVFVSRNVRRPAAAYTPYNYGSYGINSMGNFVPPRVDFLASF